MRARLETEPTLLKLDIERQTVPNRPPPISLMRIIIKNLQADHSFPKDPNSAIDLLHTIVPGAWCTFVLLDRQWCSRFEQASQQLAASGVKAPVARVYTKKGSGVDSFLADLAAWRLEANANETASPSPP